MKKVLLILFCLGISYIQVHSQELKSKKYEKSIQVLYGNANDFFYRNTNDGKDIEAYCDTCKYQEIGIGYNISKKVLAKCDIGLGIGLSYISTFAVDITPWYNPPVNIVNFNLPFIFDYNLSPKTNIGLLVNNFHHVNIIFEPQQQGGKKYNISDLSNYGAEFYARLGINMKKYNINFAYRFANYDRYFGNIHGWTINRDHPRWLNPRKWRIGLGYNF
jgi:hypothetical protein